MDEHRLVKISKYLSKHLRHQPERLGLTLESGGWVEVDKLLAACVRHRFPVSRAELLEVVAANDKQRFAFDEDDRRIRANQGHSVDVDLQLKPTTPPPVLYHGTTETAVDSILTTGLKKMLRHHVHLSADAGTALKVGGRRGRAAVFEVDAARMHAEGVLFYVSANGVWLVEEVTPEYLSLRQ